MPPVAEAAAAVETAAGDVALRLRETDKPDVLLAAVERLLPANQRIDRALDQTLALRTQFIELSPIDNQKVAVRHFLRVTSTLTDLSARLRYLLSDVLYIAAGAVATSPADRDRLLAMLIAHKSTVGADVMSELLADPPMDTETAGQIPSLAVRAKVLDLIAAAGQYELLPALAAYVADRKTPPTMVIYGAETIRRVGLPQEPRPNQDANLPKPVITARQLHGLLTRIGGSRLPSEWEKLRRSLLAWLEIRAQEGINDGRYQLGLCDVHEGDWLLMRNPSPYNLFTDLSPGLFTHVGVATVERGRDGIARMVIVDLPERGNRMPATNIETYIRQTRNYVFVRHQDPAKGRTMAQAARSVIGNETQFDLNFRTDRVAALHGQPLSGKKITTYCAGLLLLCALETGQPREAFFPLAETAAGGQTVSNLAVLGLSIGSDFISPTGALFSPQLVIAGRHDPMYDPRREVEEAIFDAFADSMANKTLVPSPDLFQSLRQKVAEASRRNPLLAQALARAANVNAETDLVSGAKAAAVIETLDEIAQGSGKQFVEAREALLAGPTATLAEDGYTPAEIARFKQYRAQHAALFDQWEKGLIAPRVLRMALVTYYVDQGRRQLDARFFSK